MQEQLSFEYATLRVVPRVEREEFLNAGVILYCPGKKFLRACLLPDNDKLLRFASALDIDEIRRHLDAICRICDGTADSPIAALDIASRFRWLTATRSTVVQSSKVHPGLCYDPADKLHKLFLELVM